MGLGRGDIGGLGTGAAADTGSAPASAGTASSSVAAPTDSGINPGAMATERTVVVIVSGSIRMRLSASRWRWRATAYGRLVKSGTASRTT